VKDKINNTGIGINGCLLWATLKSYYTTADPATRSILMSQFHTISHDLSQPADKFLQAVVTVERRLTAIAISLPPHMVQDKILGSLSSAYSTIVTHLQLESPQRDISTIINVINAWERADLQRHDSVIAAARVNQDVYDVNQGGEVAAAHLTCGHSRRADSSHSSAGKEFDWTNTRNHTDVCYRCGLPGHFAQYCISTMPEDVKRHILRNRKCAQVAENDSSDSDTGAANVAASVFTNPHIAAAAVDLPFEINIDTMDPTIRESVFGALSVPYSPPSPVADRSPTPPSPTLTASTLVAGTPEKKKKKKKKRTSTSSVQVALEKMTLNNIEEGEYSM
jgi:hypothetical protein